MEQPYDNLRNPLRNGIVTYITDYMVSCSGYRMGLCIVLLVGNFLVTDLWRGGMYTVEIIDNIGLIFYCIEYVILASLFLAEEIFILLKAIWGKLLFFFFIMFMKRAALGLYRSTDMMVKYVDDMSIVLHDVKQNYTNFHYTNILTRVNRQNSMNVSLKENLVVLGQQIDILEKAIEEMEFDLNRDFINLKNGLIDVQKELRARRLNLEKISSKGNKYSSKLEDANAKVGKVNQQNKSNVRTVGTQVVASLEDMHCRISNIQAAHNRIQHDLATAAKQNMQASTSPNIATETKQFPENKEPPSDNNYVQVSKINTTKCLPTTTATFSGMSQMKTTDFFEFPGQTPLSELIPEQIYASVELNVKSDNVEMDNVEVKCDKVIVDEAPEMITAPVNTEEENETRNVFVSIAYWESAESIQSYYKDQIAGPNIFKEQLTIDSGFPISSKPDIVEVVNASESAVDESIHESTSSTDSSNTVIQKTYDSPEKKVTFSSSVRDSEESQMHTTAASPKKPKGSGDFCKTLKTVNHINDPQNIIEVSTDDDNNAVVMGIINVMKLLTEADPDEVQTT